MARIQPASLTAFLRARISPDGTLGLQLTIGAALFIAAAWIFGGIAEDVVSADRNTVLDLQVARWFHSHARPTFTQAMLLLTNLHGTLAIGIYCALISVFLASKRDKFWLMNLIVAVPCGMLLNAVLKQIFQRARPTFDHPLLTLGTYSFPSGHTAGAALFYGFCAAYLVCRIKPRHWQILIGVSAILLVTAVGSSRIYLGVHYLSDVLAAIAASSAWLALTLTATFTWRRRKRHATPLPAHSKQ